MNRVSSWVVLIDRTLSEISSSFICSLNFRRGVESDGKAIFYLGGSEACFMKIVFQG